jgi:hypothetical protein
MYGPCFETFMWGDRITFLVHFKITSAGKMYQMFLGMM